MRSILFILPFWVGTHLLAAEPPASFVRAFNIELPSIVGPDLSRFGGQQYTRGVYYFDDNKDLYIRARLKGGTFPTKYIDFEIVEPKFIADAFSCDKDGLVEKGTKPFSSRTLSLSAREDFFVTVQAKDVPNSGPFCLRLTLIRESGERIEGPFVQLDGE